MILWGLIHLLQLCLLGFLTTHIVQLIILHTLGGKI